MNDGALPIVCVALAMAKGTTSVEPAGRAEKANTARPESSARCHGLESLELLELLDLVILVTLAVS